MKRVNANGTQPTPKPLRLPLSTVEIIIGHLSRCHAQAERAAGRYARAEQAGMPGADSARRYWVAVRQWLQGELGRLEQAREALLRRAP